MLILDRVSRRFPVVIAANRDELYARPALPPRRLADIDAVAGLDGERGGTWAGATARGFFAGVTNQRTGGPPDPTRRSRGDVVVECLRRGESAAVHDYLRGLDLVRYNPFNLIFGDARGLECAYARDGELRFEAVPPGVSVLPNDVLESPRFAAKVARAHALLGDPSELADLEWPALHERLVNTLADHQLPPPGAVSPPGSELERALAALCIHTPLYGTRSTTTVAIEHGRTAKYFFADAPPCMAASRDVSHLLTRQ
jgi:uncharacterized protein with NRDE domain